MDSYLDPHINQEQEIISRDDTRGTLTRERSIKHLGMMESLLWRFSPAERFFLYVCMALLALSTLWMLTAINNHVSVSVPAHGGSITEGEVGPARFINPILTLSQPDQDLTALVYAGLMRQLPDGSFVPDMASGYSISPDGTTYTFSINPHATFQDGTPLTSADVLFTITTAQNHALKSPQEANWVGVTVTTPDAHTVVFTLPHAYAPFIANTTLGILPKHLWQDVSSEEFPFSPLNTHPIGSGPYKISRVTTDTTGSATRYELTPFNAYPLGSPYLNQITFLFYNNDAAMNKAFDAHQIDAIAGVNPQDLASLTRTDANVVETPLPRVFGIFFNQGHNPVLASSVVRSALNTAVDKQAIVDQVLAGYGSTLDGPIPPGVLGDVSPATPLSLASTRAAHKATTATASSTASLSDAARTILSKGGWSFSTTDGMWEKGKDKLTLTLSTADEPELVATANAVAEFWKAAGVKVSVQVYPLSELNTNVIRPRAYDAVLFGEVVGPELDLYAFWHSTQRNDPGLNLAMYASEPVDTILSQARATTDTVTRDKLYAQFADTIKKDQPAIFLYSPDFLYIVSSSIKGISLGALTAPADRFANVYDWYTQTQSVWSIFAKAAR